MATTPMDFSEVKGFSWLHQGQPAKVKNKITKYAKADSKKSF
jgi:hypothetical protein